MAPGAGFDLTRGRLVRWAWLAVLLMVLSGCVHVAPYEREYLARRSMDTAEREAGEDRYQTHVFEAREGSGGAGLTAGGGCGCN